VDDHLNISSVLAFSERQDALIAAQQQVTQEVIHNNQILRKALHQENTRAEHLQQLLEAEQAKNAALMARIEQLESRPIQVNGDYVERQQIGKYIAPFKSAKRNKLNLSNDPILPLWDNATLL